MVIMLQVYKSYKFGNEINLIKENEKFGRLTFSLKRDNLTRCNSRTFLAKVLNSTKVNSFRNSSLYRSNSMSPLRS